MTLRKPEIDYDRQTRIDEPKPGILRPAAWWWMVGVVVFWGAVAVASWWSKHALGIDR